MIKRITGLLLVSSLLALTACNAGKSLTSEECALIKGKDSLMRVLTVDSPDDSLFLREFCLDLNSSDVKSKLFETLSNKMIATLIAEDGVGIAGPQVGLHRNIVVVQRFDKEGDPMEVYVNPVIDSVRGDMIDGPEGCLSVPDKRGDVPRWHDISISYSSLENGRLVRVSERIQGFTAVIFQHELDHLFGIIYTDKVL